jgi:hypothetical protein
LEENEIWEILMKFGFGMDPVTEAENGLENP